MPYSAIECCISKVPDTHHKDPSSSPERESFLPFFMFGHRLGERLRSGVGHR